MTRHEPLGRANGGRPALESAPVLAPRQQRALEALLEHGEVSAAAAAVGVNRATIRRWRQTPAFAAALREAEAEAVGDVARRLARLSSAAVAVLEGLIDEPDTPPALRLRAADLALARLVAIREHVALEERIAALEAAVGGVA